VEVSGRLIEGSGKAVLVSKMAAVE